MLERCDSRLPFPAATSLRHFQAFQFQRQLMLEGICVRNLSREIRPLDDFGVDVFCDVPWG